jgi:hypothetical protein
VLLPNAEHAIIERAKLEDYLLSFSHPVGRFKARFFAALGFSAERWAALEQAFRALHLTQHAEAGDPDGFEQPFTIRAILQDRLADRPWLSVSGSSVLGSPSHDS